MRPPYANSVETLAGMTPMGRSLAKASDPSVVRVYAGTGWRGVAVLNFGTRGTEAQLAVAVTEVTPQSVALAWVALVATPDHTVEEHRLSVLVAAASVVPGVGLIVYARTMGGAKVSGRWSVAWDVR